MNRRAQRTRPSRAPLAAAALVLLLACRQGEEYLTTVVGAQDRATKVALESSYRALAAAIETYQLENGRYPARLGDIPDVASGRLPGKDPWGSPFRYRAEGSRYEVRSDGADGREGTEDDVVLRDGQVG